MGTGNTTCHDCKNYGSSVYMITQGHNHAITLGKLLETFTCVPNGQITYSQRQYSNGEGRQNLYIISSDGRLIDYIDTHNSIVNNVKDNGGSYGQGVLDPTVDEYYYSTNTRTGWINSNSCHAHGSSVAGGTLYTMGQQCSYPVNYTFKVQSPLVFDILGDGLEFTSIKDGVQFNITGDKVEKTAWTTNMEEKGFDDAFLCIAQADNYELTFVTDSNKENYKNNYTTPIVYDGKVLNVDIATGKQLFGDQNGEKTGFEELMKYDSNSDGFIDEQDPVFKHLLLWSDQNKNGRVDYYKADCSGNNCECDYKTTHEDCLSPELKTLSDLGISSISTGYTTEYDNDNVTIKTDEHGNLIGYVGEFIRNIFNAAGELIETVTNKIVDVFFKTENS